MDRSRFVYLHVERWSEFTGNLKRFSTDLVETQDIIPNDYDYNEEKVVEWQIFMI